MVVAFLFADSLTLVEPLDLETVLVFEDSSLVFPAEVEGCGFSSL